MPLWPQSSGSSFTASTTSIALESRRQVVDEPTLEVACDVHHGNKQGPDQSRRRSTWPPGPYPADNDRSTLNTSSTRTENANTANTHPAHATKKMKQPAKNEATTNR